jgi:hypothetical protein
VNTAIPDRGVQTVLEELSPNDEWSEVDYGGRAVDVRIRVQQPNRGIHLGENQQFCVEIQPLLLAQVSYRNPDSFYTLLFPGSVASGTQKKVHQAQHARSCPTPPVVATVFRAYRVDGCFIREKTHLAGCESRRIMHANTQELHVQLLA